MKTINIVIMFFCFIIITSCNSSNENKETVTSESTNDISKEAKRIIFTDEQYQLAGIETGKIKLMNISDMIKLNGMIDVSPGSQAIISVPLGGYIRSTGFVPGQAVSKGQVIAMLESKEFIDLQQSYLQSKSQYEFLSQEYER